LRRQRHARGRRQNLRRGVIPACVHGPATIRARRAREAPAHRRIRMPAAGHRRLKSLHCAQFHACRIRHKRQQDVADDIHRGRGGFRRVGLAHRCNCKCRGRWQIARCGVQATRRDGAHHGVSTWHPVHAPVDSGVIRIRDGRYERRRRSEYHRPARRRDRHHNRWRRWRRRGRYRACPSSSAAQRPSSRRKESGNSNSLRTEIRVDDPRKGPHALGKAGEGPAKEKEPLLGIRESASATAGEEVTGNQ